LRATLTLARSAVRTVRRPRVPARQSASERRSQDR
jgi:hypothetical protein